MPSKRKAVESESESEEPTQTQEDVDMTTLKSGKGKSKKSEDPETIAQRKLGWNRYNLFSETKRPDIVKKGTDPKEAAKILSAEWKAHPEWHEEYEAKLKEMKKKINEEWPHLKAKPRTSPPANKQDDGVKKPKGPKTVRHNLGHPLKPAPGLFMFKPEKQEGEKLDGSLKKTKYNQLPAEERAKYEADHEKAVARQQELIKQFEQEDKAYLQSVLVN